MISLLLVTLSLLSIAPFSFSQYLLYCPCMGRFGNQADQLLGSMAFSKSLNRTLVLPPFISYSTKGGSVTMLPWDSVFDLDRVSEFMSVITMEDFMSKLAPSIWPASQRSSFCFSPRPGDALDSCNAKHGSPFGPFWDSFGVSFVKSEMYAPLTFSTNHNNINRWKEKFPANKYPVLSMTGAPSSFPVSAEHVSIQRHVSWSRDLLQLATSWVNKNIGQGERFLGIHLRNGGDWTRACVHVESPGVKNLFASPQCLGYGAEHGSLTMELCSPNSHTIIQQLTETISGQKYKHVFVASDHDHMIGQLNKMFHQDGVSFHKLEEDNFLLDLVILSISDHFIGNCVSSYTAVVKRIRDNDNKDSSFWAFKKKVRSKEEL